VHKLGPWASFNRLQGRNHIVFEFWGIFALGGHLQLQMFVSGIFYNLEGSFVMGRGPALILLPFFFSLSWG